MQETLRRKRKPNSVPSVFLWTSLKTHEVEIKNLCIASKGKLEKPCDIKSGFHEIILNDEQYQDAIIINVRNFMETSTCESDGQSVKCSEREPPSAIYTEYSCQTMSLPILSIEKYVKVCLCLILGYHLTLIFFNVLYSLGEAAFYLNYIYNQVQKLTIENHFFLTLIK